MNELSSILSKVKGLKSTPPADLLISSITFDSRECVKGSIFVAIKGTQFDGHQFIDQAIKNGSKVIVCENLPLEKNKEIQYIVVEDSSSALGEIASAFYNHPSRKLKLTGVTGTNGKTSIASMLFNLFTSLGYHCGLISTIENKIGSQIIPATHTTPDPVKLNKLMNEMLEDGVSHCFMEVSSHSLDQNRIAGLSFTGGIFTNITRDHLDYHKTFDNYIKAKKKFFDLLPDNAFALTNNDDKSGMVMLQNCNARKFTYSLKSASDFKIKILENHFEGLLLKINGIELWSNLVGTFNAYNLLAVYAGALLLGESSEEVLTQLSIIKTAQGRFDHFVSQTGIHAIIDYAHTPDALENVLTTIQDIRNENQKIITVVGAGGNRDKGKRPLMAKVAGSLSHQLILTSDNPRDEKPEQIIEDMLSGLNDEMKKNTLMITDRKQAIKTACMLAEKEDIILIAGKGHENYQIINGEKFPFDDKKIIQEFLK